MHVVLCKKKHQILMMCSFLQAHIRELIRFFDSLLLSFFVLELINPNAGASMDED